VARRGGFGSAYNGPATGAPARTKGTFGSRYAGAGGARVVNARPRKPKHHGGFLHGLEHVAGQTLTDFKDVAVNLPGGLYHTGGGLIHHPVQTVEAMGKSTLQDLRHPLRHPGYTALDLLGIAGGGAEALARVSLAARTGRAGALLRHAAAGERVYKVGEGTVHGVYARSALARGAQKLTDRARTNHPEMRFGLRNRAEKVGQERVQNERVRQVLANRPAHQLVAATRKLKPHERLALRVVAEEVPLEQRIAHAEAQLQNATGRTKRLLTSHLKQLRRVETVVHDVRTPEGDVLPRFHPDNKDLIHAYERTKEVALKREHDLIDAGLLTAEGAAKRKGAVGEIVRQDLHHALGFNPDIVREVFDNREGFYVTYKTGRTPASLYKPAQLGSQHSIGIPRTPSELNHELTGGALRTGDVNPDTPRVVAESALGSNRILALWRQRDELKTLAKDAPETEHDIPIRPIWLKNKKWPAEVRDVIDRVDHADPEEQASMLQRLHDFVLPKRVDVAGDTSVKWIDSRLLGKANLPRPLVGVGQHVGAKRVLGFTDAVNNAERIALLYAKPAYAVPNVLGNVALNLVHGVYSPRNLAVAARWTGKLDTETHALEDALMGEGVVTSVAGHTGIGHKIVEKAAKVWQPLVDTRFRRAAFRYEARRAGFNTPAKYKALLNDSAHEAKLIDVTRRANSAIIDYGRLGPVEQDLVRRIVFLYPWVKGATIYAGHFLAEHPIQSAVVGQMGKQQLARRKTELGPVPSWAEALFTVGHRGNQPLVSNPAAAAILQTPAQVLEAAREAVGGNVRSAYDLSSFLNPAGGAALAALSRKQPFTGYSYKPSDSALKILAENLYGGVPALTLYQRTHGKQRPHRTFPMTRRDALLQFLLGSVAPRPVDVRQLHARAKAEQTGR
jgi:hypothetical protein